ncbi:MAG: DUF4242 domain-containing protein [Acidobacteria bacterium]|nr:DUF4242 domain-containing protein [Acidobacteriota bacterium]
MPEFVIEREIPNAGALSDAELKDLSLRSLDVIQGMKQSVQWLHSYVCDNKVYCVYLSPDEAEIKEHAKRLGLPADRVSRVRRLLNPTLDAADPVRPARA